MKEKRNNLLNLILIIGFSITFIATVLDIPQNFPEACVVIGTFAGLFNAYYTSKKKIWFIIPDYIWILTTLITLFIAKTYTDMWLYVFYLIIGAVQFFNWKKNYQNNEAILKYGMDKVQIGTFVGIIIITIVLYIAMPNSANRFIGSINTGVGIGAAFLLSQRYFNAEILFIVTDLIGIYLAFMIKSPIMSVTFLVFLANSLVFIIYNKKEIDLDN